MTRGKKKENIGPCKICGCKNTTEIYRKLNANTLAEAHKGPEAHLLPVTIKLMTNFVSNIIINLWYTREIRQSLVVNAKKAEI